jgi:hypothetical protein
MDAALINDKHQPQKRTMVSSVKTLSSIEAYYIILALAKHQTRSKVVSSLDHVPLST